MPGRSLLYCGVTGEAGVLVEVAHADGLGDAWDACAGDSECPGEPHWESESVSNVMLVDGPTVRGCQGHLLALYTAACSVQVVAQVEREGHLVASNGHPQRPAAGSESCRCIAEVGELADGEQSAATRHCKDTHDFDAMGLPGTILHRQAEVATFRACHVVA